MADIRSFFGGGGGKANAPVQPAQSLSKAGRKMVIEDDDDDDEGSSENQPVTAAAAPTPAPSAVETKTKAPAAAAAAAAVVEQATNATAEAIPSELKDVITWKAGESVPYLAIVNIFERVSAVSGRLEKENLFCKLFRAVILMTPTDLIDIVYLVSNTVAPAFEGLELGIGESLLVKAVCESTGRNKNAVEEEYNREGDLGVVAQNSRSNQKTLSFASKPTPLLASHVLKQFRLITQTKGDKAQQKKVEIIKGLMVKGQGAEVKYIVRALQGNLRTGSAKQTALVSLAQAFVHSPTPAVRDLVLSDNGKEKLPGYVDVPEDEGDNGEEDENGGCSSSRRSKDFFSPKKAASASASAQPASSPAPAAAAGAAGAAEAETGVQVTEPAAEAEEVDLSVLVSRVRQVEPAEAKKLRRTSAGKAKSSLGKEEREELAVAAVKRAFADCPSYALLCEALLTRPLYQLYLACRLVPGVPVSPMLAKPTKEIGEVLRRLSGLAFTMEYKYDGERAQVHLLPDGSVKIFSRNSLDDTNKYPDLAEVIRRAKNDKIESCVIDCEVVAFDREKGCLLPFQILSTRKRKVEDGEEDAQKVSIYYWCAADLPLPLPLTLPHSLAPYTHTHTGQGGFTGLRHVVRQRQEPAGPAPACSALAAACLIPPRGGLLLLCLGPGPRRGRRHGSN